MATVSPLLTVDYAQYLFELGFRLLSFGADAGGFRLYAEALSRDLRQIAASQEAAAALTHARR
jgi:hypothetical protein